MYNLRDEDKVKLIESGEFHQLYSFDKNSMIREKVAMYTSDKEIITRLSMDNSREVRATIASHHPLQTYHELMYDEDWLVRRCLVDQEIDEVLDYLRYDSEWMIRSAVAGFGRDKDFHLFIEDPSPLVRMTLVWNTNIENIISIIDTNEKVNAIIKFRLSNPQQSAV